MSNCFVSSSPSSPFPELFFVVGLGLVFISGPSSLAGLLHGFSSRNRPVQDSTWPPLEPFVSRSPTLLNPEQRRPKKKCTMSHDRRSCKEHHSHRAGELSGLLHRENGPGRPGSVRGVVVAMAPPLRRHGRVLRLSAALHGTVLVSTTSRHRRVSIPRVQSIDTVTSVGLHHLSLWRLLTPKKKRLPFSHLGISTRYSHRPKSLSRHSTGMIATQQTGNHISGTHRRPKKSDLPCQCYTYSPSLGP